MKILILGAHGNLGQQLLQAFSEFQTFGLGAQELDITNEDLVLKRVKEINPTIIINAAAYNAVDKCEVNSEEFIVARQVNADVLNTLSRAALSCGAVLVHYSTDYVFDGEQAGGYDEDSLPSPVNKYGFSKLAGEKNVMRFGDRGLKYYIIRTSRLFGPQGKSSNAKKSFFDIMFQKINEGQEIKSVDDEVASFAYTPDVAAETKKLILQNKEYGIYHLVNSEQASWYEAAVELSKMLGNEDYKIEAISGDSLPRPAKRPKNSVLQNTKIEPLRSWQDALREYITTYIIK